MFSDIRVCWSLAIALATTSCWAQVADLKNEAENRTAGDAGVSDSTMSGDSNFPHHASDASDAAAKDVVAPPDQGTGEDAAAADVEIDTAEIDTAPPVVNLVNGGDMENGCAGFSYFATLSSSSNAH